MHYGVGGGTHPGTRREQNQDAFRAWQVHSEQVSSDLLCLAVADGVGGHAYGKEASDWIMDALRQRCAFLAAAEQLDKDRVQAQLSCINRRLVMEKSRLNRSAASMNTTLTALFIRDDNAIAGHIGNCRIYRLRQKSLTCLSKDHTWVQEAVDSGEMSPAEAQRHPRKHVLTRAMGFAGQAAADAFCFTVEPGDRYLLCSDGLFEALNETEIHKLLSGRTGEQETAERLIQKSLMNGADDNVTALVVFARTREPGERSWKRLFRRQAPLWPDVLDGDALGKDGRFLVHDAVTRM